MQRFISGYNLTTSMSEKKSTSNTKIHCVVCDRYLAVDFFALPDLGDGSFILCDDCEAIGASENIYGGGDGFPLC